MVRTQGTNCVSYCFSCGSDLLTGLVLSGLRRDTSESELCVGGDADGLSGEVVPASNISGRASSSSASSDNILWHMSTSETNKPRLSQALTLFVDVWVLPEAVLHVFILLDTVDALGCLL